MNNSAPTAMGGSRQSAKNVILSKVQRLRREADNLEALANSLPDDMSGPAEEAL